MVGVALGGYATWKWFQRYRFIRSLRVARITPEELMARIAGGADTVVVDLRSAAHVASDGQRIPGALQMHPGMGRSVATAFDEVMAGRLSVAWRRITTAPGGYRARMPDRRAASRAAGWTEVVSTARA